MQIYVIYANHAIYVNYANCIKLIKTQPKNSCFFSADRIQHGNY